MKMHKGFALLGLGAVLASCGVSSDLRLAVYTPAVITEYRTSAGTYVGCDNLTQGTNTASSKTQVRVDFRASGFLKSASVQLIGEDKTDQTQEKNFVATFNRSSNDLKERSTNDYTVVFDADPGSAQNPTPLPAGEAGGVTAQGITVSPAFRTIKVVSVSEANRAEPPNGGFRARVIGYSDNNAAATAPLSNLVPVYSNCTFVQDTATPIFQ